MKKEKRLIDAEELNLAVRDDVYIDGRNYARVKKHIDDARPVDAVEVVRCKDCKYYRESEHPERSGINFCFRLMHPTEDRRIGYNFGDKDFCSYGERRADETN